jgi:VanZ family protein
VLPLRLAGLWAFGGICGAVLGLVLSLWPGGAPLPVHVWDKLQHVVGYFLLVFWYVGIYPRQRDPLIGAAALGFGILIEGLQALTPTRSAELGDVLAEVIGIAIAIGLARAGLGGWALGVERVLGLAPR